MTDDRIPVANIPPFGLRMQPNLKSRVEEAARVSGRSINAEIVSRLEASFERWPKVSLPQYVREMADEAGDTLKDEYEWHLNKQALELAKEIFSHEDFQLIEMINAFNNLLKDVNPEKTADATNKLQNFMEELTDDMPEEKRLRAAKTIHRALYRTQKA